MAVGTIARAESARDIMRNAPVEAVAPIAPPAQAAAPQMVAPPKEAQGLPPLDPKATREAKFYTARRTRINAQTLDDAPLAKSMAYTRARAKVAIGDLPPARTGVGPTPEASKPGDAATQAVSGKGAAAPTGPCSSCSTRVYQDGSNDPGVSFQSPKGMPASMSGVMVAAHEGEHVSRETERAFEQDQVVTQRRVSMQVAFCPECHRMYFAGGTTTIATAPARNTAQEGGLSVQNAADMLTNLGNAADLTA